MLVCVGGMLITDELDTHPLPAEVEVPDDTTVVAYGLKRGRGSRGEHWDTVLYCSEQFGVPREPDYAAWRKAHTENYHVYFYVEENKRPEPTDEVLSEIRDLPGISLDTRLWCTMILAWRECRRAQKDHGERANHDRRPYVQVATGDELKVVQEDLLHAMSSISEARWSARWCHRLEVLLWREVDAFRLGTVEGLPPVSNVALLDHLSRRCDGWYTWSRSRHDTMFVPMPKWLELYTDNKSTEYDE